MSFSNPQVKNPATRFFQWKGGAEAFKDEKTGKTRHEGGKIVWYDKEAQKEVEQKLPFSFIVLDELNTITGYSESLRSGFWSNEVRNLQNDTLVVKAKSGSGARTIASGLYAQISDKLKAEGAKYTKSVYIAYKDDTGELQIGHIKIAGSALSAWIEFTGKYNVEQCAVFITDEPKLSKKGSNYYFAPVFDAQNIDNNTREQVVKLDEELQTYLTNYFSRKPAEEAAAPAADDDIEIEDVETPVNLEADSEEETATEDSPEPAPKADDGKINLKDVPF